MSPTSCRCSIPRRSWNGIAEQKRCEVIGIDAGGILVGGNPASVQVKASTISTAQLHVLPRVHLPPIYPLVLRGSYPMACAMGGRPHLGVGFALRCFQRFSAPALATRHCRWHDNRHTSGPSTPVLSY